MPRAAIVLGSESDRPAGEEAKKMLHELGVDCEVVVHSAHRDPDGLQAYVASSDARVFIAVAGLSAALPGFIASRTVRPVVGVPRDVKLGGLDALLSMVQMPTGVPVATVGIENARNAAFLAAEILGLTDNEIAARLEAWRAAQRSRRGAS
ncbi:MAG: 5-(carboxyamino)imidazole ribonucleotide mutase [Candidatus Bathyarchaeia archaeon]